jgi:hypothetical protein
MNQFFYEQRGKEKVRDLQAEGVRSQAFHRSGASKLSIFPSLQQLILGFLGDRKITQDHSTDFNPTPTTEGE